MDFDWKDWGSDHYGEFRWNPKKFPDGASGAFKRAMDAQGIKLLGIMKPRIREDAEQGRWAAAHDCWYPGDVTALDYQSGQPMRNLNFYKASCRTWFWSHAQGAFDTGISGWWNDEQDFGDYLLAAPVVDQGQTVKPIYLPPGTWYDYFRGTTYMGGRTIQYPVNAATWADIPLFIKQGAIIPTQAAMDYVGQRPVTGVDVAIFPGPTRTTFDYYDDDGVTYAYEHGAYFSQQIAAQALGTMVRLDIAAPHGSYRPALRSYLCAVHTAHPAGAVRDGSVALPRYPSLAALRAANGSSWATGRDVHGVVTYLKLAAGSRHAVLIESVAG